MEHSNTCKKCGQGHYQFGSALYDYYSCGHAWEKPFPDENPAGKWIRFNPYRGIAADRR